jgi:hypothetical protein
MACATSEIIKQPARAHCVITIDVPFDAAEVLAADYGRSKYQDLAQCAGRRPDDMPLTHGLHEGRNIGGIRRK